MTNIIAVCGSGFIEYVHHRICVGCQTKWCSLKPFACSLL